MNVKKLNTANLIYGLLGIALLFFGWFWFKVSFVAQESEWWASNWVFIISFLGSLASGLLSIRTTVGAITTLLSSISLIVILILTIG